MSAYRVLVIGGYGFFGSRLVRRLARQPNLRVIVAGRALAKAEALVRELEPEHGASFEAIEVDASSPDLARQLRRTGAELVIHTSGPFQDQDYGVARACAQAGLHYIDLADGRAFVSGITALDEEARAAGIFMTSGASSVPALSSAAADRLATGLDRIDEIDIGISPGNRTERGLATVAGILSYCGKPLPKDAGGRTSIGWLGCSRFTYPPPVGSRLLSPCDVPDLALLPPRYPGTPVVRFGAGLELAVLHRGMNLMAWAAQVGWVRDWSAHAGWLRRAADLFKRFGSDAGAMHLRLSGIDREGREVARTWMLSALAGDGPFVPTLAASALARKLSNGTWPYVGARPCVGCLSLEDFALEAEGLQITMGEAKP
ncbi:Saccharopine dehydrogenase family protein [Burkholderiales bacterium 8X]|nr:Saccharopine dehydrogenase family protein [Burkholderiales bacterium 8X]